MQVLEITTIGAPIVTVTGAGLIAWRTLRHSRVEANRRDLEQAVDRLLAVVVRADRALVRLSEAIDGVGSQHPAPSPEVDAARRAAYEVADDLEVVCVSLEMRVEPGDPLGIVARLHQRYVYAVHNCPDFIGLDPWNPGSRKAMDAQKSWRDARKVTLDEARRRLLRRHEWPARILRRTRRTAAPGAGRV